MGMGGSNNQQETKPKPSNPPANKGVNIMAGLDELEDLA
jgi:hypothetical protein